MAMALAMKVNNSLEDAVTDKPDSEDKKRLGSAANEDHGSFSNRGMYVRGDKIDFKSWDIQMERHLTKILSLETQKQNQKRKQDWEIDSSKLHLRHIIDRGAYGTVYRGVYDGQDVAVKVFDWREGTTDAAALRASFQQEVAVWHKLSHPNVTKFVGASTGTSYLKLSSGDISSEVSFLTAQSCCVVEYVPGGTLKKFLMRNRREKLAFKVVIQLALDLSRGLSYLHSKRIVHRDVKTENVLLDACRTVKIADFGVARIEAQNPEDMTGETGTLAYMAPEVLDGKPYNRKCDVYSFGICLWEIYCCDMPYRNLSFANISTAVVRKNLRPQIPRCCPKPLARIMRRCWDANPDKRPDMDEVVRLLEAVDTSKGGGMIPEDQTIAFLCFCVGRGP